jgi:hypothetical protein
MNRSKGTFLFTFVGILIFVWAGSVTAAAQNCFAANPGAGNTNKTDHYRWAQSQSLDTLVNDLWAKIVMVYNCTSVSDDQAARAFGEISALIARRANDARCFNGDAGVINPDASAHERWARTKTRVEMRDNLGWKALAALRCLDAGNNRLDFFAEASAMLARVPGGATPASSGNCNSGQYSLAGVPPARQGQQITVNWTAPANHPDGDWIGMFPENATPAEGRTVAWQWVPKGPCGYVILTAPGPGRYYIYYLANRGYSPIGGGVFLAVSP